jgi:DNA-binding CsgD family transcriptional regulator
LIGDPDIHVSNLAKWCARKVVLNSKRAASAFVPAFLSAIVFGDLLRGALSGGSDVTDRSPTSYFSGSPCASSAMWTSKLWLPQQKTLSLFPCSVGHRNRRNTGLARLLRHHRWPWHRLGRGLGPALPAAQRISADQERGAGLHRAGCAYRDRKGQGCCTTHPLDRSLPIPHGPGHDARLLLPQSSSTSLGRSSGAERARPGKRRKQQTPGGLSRRELEIAGLVAAGLTNRAIAERLFLAERTVESHLNHIMTKLDFSSRAQVASWMTQQRLDAPGGGTGR